jgi:hypothetical protein
MRRYIVIPLLVASALLYASPASAQQPVGKSTSVVHNEVETVDFSDDVCGERSNTTVFTRRLVQEHFSERADGSFQYHYVAVVTYVSDYDDAALPTLTGRLTEVINANFTGRTFTSTVSFRDFFGDVQIHVHFHLTEVDGQVTAERESTTVTGCP